MKAAALLIALFAAVAPARHATARAATALAPFVATYQAYNAGAPAGNATMRLGHGGAAQWRIDLGIRGDRGFAGIVGLNIEQSTLFDVAGDRYRPLTQSTLRKVAFWNKKSVGVYDWTARRARWSGDVKAARRQPIALQDGDMSGLLINLAVIRDAAPGKALQYRFVDGGRVREHHYQVSAQTETVAVGELRYEALRVSRTNGGNDETIFWVADGVPTPIRILQRTDGADAIDLRLIAYQGNK